MENRWCNLAVAFLMPLVFVSQGHSAMLDRAHIVEYQVACPDLFDARRIRFDAIAQGWTPFAPSSLMVTAGAIIYGAPVTRAGVEPSAASDGRYETMATWQMRQVPGLQKWLNCGYGAANELTLSKIIPQDVFVCTVITSKDLQAKVTGVVARCLRELKTPPPQPFKRATQPPRH
ncbi:STY0301 family protein [Duganella aceris]|uniref:DUF4136 domain-containing protein n=1 Tax=Duganella aceris TaxID=2703883 RepID=A0ABX0FC04_9BURK|nr:STY0301 family protein [Duganella aceris]NGZ82877.1 hypothetical protein [Duganella aceris]